jgi:choline dehydrogenase-like flavoprotein
MVLFDYQRRRPAPARPISACIRWDGGQPGGLSHRFIMNAIDSVAPRRARSALGAYLVTLLRPVSTGRVWITSPDPDVPPQVDLGLLSNPADSAALRSGLGLLRDLLADPRVRELGSPVGSLIPGVDAAAEEIDKWLERHCTESWHLVGSCRMGAENDPGAVVDPSCRVVGVDGLMVVDASVIPRVPSANTALITMAVAHHAFRPPAVPTIRHNKAGAATEEVMAR